MHITDNAGNLNYDDAINHKCTCEFPILEMKINGNDVPTSPAFSNNQNVYLIER